MREIILKYHREQLVQPLQLTDGLAQVRDGSGMVFWIPAEELSDEPRELVFLSKQAD